MNPPDSPQHRLDLETLKQAGYQAVMLPKAQSAEQVLALHPLKVIALAETPAGVLAALELARADNTLGLMWGAEDLIAALGGRSSRRADGTYREVGRFARSAVLLAASAAGKFALDAVHLDIPDLDGLRAEAQDAAASGFAATVCIHPSQLPVVRAAYRPDPAELAWAQRVLAAAEKAGRGVFNFEGQMVDAPVLRQAGTILSRA